ncbi:MAG: dTMP kinase [Proteobacteria bacterium]|nr:MAG: dTMP kinase [Pseudomonadota bacterium]
MQGRFITVEGTDGAGKTTQIEFVRDYLTSLGISCVLTREPGGTAIGEAIRELLLRRSDLHVTSRAQLLLVFAARAQHIEEIIAPSLARGDWVVCDRFTDATYAYQGGAGNLGFDAVAAVENWVQGTFRPDLTLLFDVPVETGFARVCRRGADGDRFEILGIEQKNRIRNAYLQLAERHPDRIVVIDAIPDIETVSSHVARVLDAHITRWRDQ